MSAPLDRDASASSNGEKPVVSAEAATPATPATPDAPATPEAADPRFDRILEHSYDGIQEYDNPMPRWWLLTFAGTIIFSVIYVFDIGPVGNGKGRIADYEAEIKSFAASQPAPSGSGVSAEQLLALQSDEEALELGEKTYAASCAACHRGDAGGLIGPNLTDAYWLHGGAITDVYNVIVNGVLEKGMPPWGRSLKPAQLEAVVAYVASLQNTTPANPKPPQGTLVAP